MAVSDTKVQILDATFDLMADVGLARLGLEDVATRAGVSRQTVYRYFGSRNGLISAVVVREEQRLLAEVTRASDGHDALEPALRAALVTMLTWTRDHPLLGKLLASEPEAVLPFLAAGGAPVLDVARSAVVDVLGGRLPDDVDGGAAADVLARVMLSYAIDPPVEDPAEVADGLARLVVHGVAGATGA